MKQEILKDHNERCQKQQPTKISFSWKKNNSYLKNYKEKSVTVGVYADFECVNQR